MATQEKLLKSLETLRSLMNSNSSSDISLRRKEKIQHCNIITETMGNSAIRIAPNFRNLLGLSMEMLLQLCDDFESDIRMTADECLNRLIRDMSNGNMSKIQIELHKEIQKNGAARSLRAALSKFAELAHHIRPHKGKPYITNLLPCIIKITERSEELIHETLLNSYPKIISTLGCFATDNDIKSLLRAFVNNISNNSAVIRRTMINCVLSTCVNCKKPYIFITYILNNLLDLLLPIQVSHSTPLILAILGCLKAILPHIKNCSSDQEIKDSFGIRKEVNETYFSVDRLLQVYEICLHYMTSNDHNIVNASLETLNSLLQNSTSDLTSVLLSPQGICKSRISFLDSNERLKPRSPSQLSVATPLSGDDTLETQLMDSLRPDIEKWIDESKLSVSNITYARTTDYVDKLGPIKTRPDQEEAQGYSNISIETVTDGSVYNTNTEKDMVETLNKLELSETSSERSFTQHTDDKSLATGSDDLNQAIDIGNFQDKDVPLNYCTRLIVKSFLLNGLPNTMISDKKVRVSVKSLSLTCLGTIISTYPKVFLTYLDKNHLKDMQESSYKQPISDVLQYKDHTDPQLRGSIRIIIGNFLKSVILKSFDNYQIWVKQNSVVDDNKTFELSSLINILVKGLEDESSNCLRQTLQSLTVCLKCILESENSLLIKPVLHALPRIAQNRYWLVKISLLEVICDIHYVSVEHIIGTSEFQDKVLYNILFELLKYDNNKVRAACSTAIVQIVPHLYFKKNIPNESTTTNKAKFYKSLYFSNLFNPDMDINVNKKYLISNMPFPFNVLCKNPVDSIDQSLSRILSKLNNFLLTSHSKHFLFGCVETLAMLSDSYPPTLYPDAWGCFPNMCVSQNENLSFHAKDKDLSLSSSMDFFQLCINLLSNSSISYDLKCHLNLLKLCGNLLCGLSIPNFKSKSEFNVDDSIRFWDMFHDEHLSNLTEQFFNHILKLLNIFYHVIEEILPLPIQNKPVLPNLPTSSSMSPIKRRKSDFSDKYKIIATGKSLEKEEKLEKKVENVKLNGIGNFANAPHYLKIYELLKTAYSNYKTSLDTEASEKCLGLLRTVLHTLSQLLEIATLFESGRISEEILSYFYCTFNLEPSCTVTCVQQLLKSLFGTNLTSNISKIIEKRKIVGDMQEENSLFYQSIFRKPYLEISLCINGFNNSSKLNCDGDDIVMGYLHRKDSKKSMVLPRGADTILTSYIRLFEPMVIKSLKQYTITSDVKLQCCVLQLLCKLVQLRVNYCLLDSEQIFIGFVLQQFEYLEEGQILSSSELIPQIFNFLVHLSYGKQHSKSIIGVPKIIQLCDGLMASGQPPLSYCIPALEPVVEDIFLCRNKSNTSDFKELETTREVLLSMILRLMEYPDVVHLLTLILNESKYCNDNTDKWYKWSKQVADVFIPMLKQTKVIINDKKSLTCIRKLIYVLNPSVFKPINEILIILFDESPNQNTVLSNVNRWLGKILSLLLIVLQVKEELFLLKIMEVHLEFSPRSVFRNVKTTFDPLNVSNGSNIFNDMFPEIIFVRYIFRIIDIAVEKCVEIVNIPTTQEEIFLIEQSSSFLLFCMHIFQSGSHCKIANAAINLINGKTVVDPDHEELPIESINNNIIKISPFFPTLSIEWCYLLTLMNYNNRKFWSAIIQINESYGDDQSNESLVSQKVQCINLEIVRTGGTIAFCDYLNENLSEAKPWFLVHNIRLLVQLCDEEPICEFFSSLHRNSVASGLIIQAINTKCLPIPESTLRMKALKSMKNIHSSQVGTLLNSLLPNFLDCRQLTLSRLVTNLASRKIELLLTMPPEEVRNQFPREDLEHIMDLFVKQKLVKKHETLVGLLNRLATQYYDLNPLEFEKVHGLNAEHIKNMEINKSWYVSQIQSKCCSCNVKPEVAELLNCLSHDDLLNIMSNKDFNRKILKHSITWSTNFIKEKSLDEEPDLLKASIHILTKNIVDIVNVLPESHQVYQVFRRNELPMEAIYSNVLTELFSNNEFWNSLYDLMPAVVRYIDSLPVSNQTVPTANLPSFLKFSVLCLECVNFLIYFEESSLNINCVDIALNCAKVILTSNYFQNILLNDTFASWLFSAVNSLYKLVSYLLLGNESFCDVPKYGLSSSTRQSELSKDHACYQLSELISWLQKQQHSLLTIPKYLFVYIKDIIVTLGRKSFVNSYLLIPIGAWKNGLQLNNNDSTLIPPLLIEYLQDVDVLEEFIYRITFFGWTSRQQFEETWMCLLSVMNTNPIEENITDDTNNVIHVTSLSIQAITTLLLQTLSTSVIGDINNSEFLHVPRDLPIDANTKCITKLKYVHNKLQIKLIEDEKLFKRKMSILNVFNKPNLERLTDCYSFGLLSIEYILISSRIVESSGESTVRQIYENQQNILHESGLDLNSCVQFLIDLYSQWIKAQNTPLRILHEVVKSILGISDLFTDRFQFSWMLDICLDLVKVHTIEDEIIHHYLIISICKAAAVLTPDIETYEVLKKLITQNIKSGFLPTKIACLHGLLYILQGCVLGNTHIGGLSEEMQIIFPIIIDYIDAFINSINGAFHQSLEHNLLVWAIAFYVIENIEQSYFSAEFVPNVVQSAITYISQHKVNTGHIAILKGLERLVIKRSISEKICTQLSKLSLDLIKNAQTSLTIPAFQMLLSCMYMNAVDDLENDVKTGVIVQSNPDNLVNAIEQISAIFDYIKRGFLFEVEIVTSILPDILNDFFPPSDILTKVLGEFLSPQQPHPRLLSRVVFKVFQYAIEQSQLSLLQDWVVFTLSNFTQSFSIGMATWCLTCFFISASVNEWLKSFFPHVQSRIGRYEHEDRMMLCIAGADFYKNLTNEKQKEIFVETFTKVKDEINMPFQDLLGCL